MIALDSHHGKPLIFASAIPHCRDNLEEACDVGDEDFEKVMTMMEEKKN